MIGRWKRMTQKERGRSLIILCLLAICLYGSVFYPYRHKKMGEAEALLHRRQDRIDKRADLGKVKGSGLNPEVLEKKIAKTEELLAAEKASLNELDSGFVPIDSNEERQLLMLEISRLAQRTGVDLLLVARKGYNPESELTSAVLDPQIGRPLLEVTANCDYGQMISFISGLKDLSYYVSVMRMRVYSRHVLEERRTLRDGYLPSGAIYMSLELSI